MIHEVPDDSFVQSKRSSSCSKKERRGLTETLMGSVALFEDRYGRVGRKMKKKFQAGRGGSRVKQGNMGPVGAAIHDSGDLAGVWRQGHMNNQEICGKDFCDLQA